MDLNGLTNEETLDHTPLGFGKHAGKTPDQVSDSDPGYVIWLYESCSPKLASRALYTACRDDVADAGDWF